MPNDNYYFYSNLNFIYNYKDNTTFTNECSECSKLYKTLNFNLMKSRLAISQNQNFEISKKTKCLNKIDDISYTLETLIKKVDKADDTVKYVYQEAQKLEGDAKSKNITDIVYKKSEILHSKLNHTIASINMIKNIFDGAKDKIDSINYELRKPSPNLSQIYKLTKEILQLTTDYNITKLKRAQQKFEKSKELNDFMYGKKNPKLAHLFSSTNSVPMDDKSEPCELRTPFGSVWVKISNTDNSRMIYTHRRCGANDAPKYDTMCTDLDWYFDPSTNNICDRQDAIDGIISPIIKYINQSISKGQHLLGTYSRVSSPQILFRTVKFNYPILPNMRPSYKHSAAFLCGVLLLSESHEFRNPTGGKFERKAMNNVKCLAEKGCQNPFGVVFNNNTGRFIPAKDKSEFKTITGLESDDKAVVIGGQRQASILINLHSIDVRYFLPNSKFDKRNLNSVASAYETDYIDKVTIAIRNFNYSQETWKIRKNMLQSGKLSIKIQTTGNKYIEKYAAFCKGFAFIKKLKAATERTTFDIDELPDITKDSILAKLKEITKVKNLKRFNKLMNGL